MNDIDSAQASRAAPRRRRKKSAPAAGRSARIGDDVLALQDSPWLARVSASAAALARDLYPRAPLRHAVGNVQWHFCWRPVSAPPGFAPSAVELSLRISGAPVSIFIDDLSAFGDAQSVMRSELPPELRVAYLSGIGAPLWSAVEAITQCPVELLEVRLTDTCSPVPSAAGIGDRVGFELGRAAQGVLARGWVTPGDDLARYLLRETSRRVMAPASAPMELPVRWASVVGTTTISLADLRTLENEDTLLIDDADCTADGLNCWLGAGVNRRYIGRALLRRGQLEVIEIATQGNARMDTASKDAGATPAQQTKPHETGFDDIQVTLHFELAQWHAPLSAVASMAAGSVIDIDRRIDEPSVSVWAEHRCIGHGQLVAVGDRLGVRMMSVFGDSMPGSARQDRSEVSQGNVPAAAGSARAAPAPSGLAAGQSE